MTNKKSTCYWRKSNINKQQKTRIYYINEKNENKQIKAELFYFLVKKISCFKKWLTATMSLLLPNKSLAAITTAFPNTAANAPRWATQLWVPQSDKENVSLMVELSSLITMMATIYKLTINKCNEINKCNNIRHNSTKMVSYCSFVNDKVKIVR